MVAIVESRPSPRGGKVFAGAEVADLLAGVEVDKDLGMELA